MQSVFLSGTGDVVYANTYSCKLKLDPCSKYSSIRMPCDLSQGGNESGRGELIRLCSTE